MVLTENIELPTPSELEVQEINLTYSVLQAAAFHLGKYCESKNNEFMLCKTEEHDPRKCINEGKLVTACALEFFKKIKIHCLDEFNQYYTCLDKSSDNSSFSPCRKTQGIYDKCVLENLKIERPSFGYFCEAKIHDSLRPKPKANIPVYLDTPVPVTIEDPLPTPKYNSRRIYY